MDFIKMTEDIYPKVREWRHHIHAHPELSGQEKETASYICSVLDEYGIPYQANVAGYGIVAQVGHGSHAVGIRADIDALPVTEDTGLECSSLNPGVMHACGHDMHASMLMGTGAVLKSLESEIDAMDGAVKLFFQPAEETIGGAQPMIEAGCMENPRVERVIALHMDPNYEVGTIVLKYGPVNAQTQGFSIRVEGKSCHGAHPEGGIDAIVMASEIVMSLQTISSRVNSPTTPIIVTVGSIHAGTAGNIVAGTVDMTGTVRALSSEVMEKNKAVAERIVKGVAQAYGGTATISWDDDFYPALINDDEVTALAERCGEELFGRDMLRFMPEPSLGGDDFAFFGQAAPGSYIDIGTALPDSEFYALHSEHFAPPDEAMKSGVAIECKLTMELLNIICK